VRLYDSAVVALALDVEPKWLDNFIARAGLSQLTSGTSGKSRRFSVDTVVRIAVARTLMDRLEVPMPVATRLASAILAGDGTILRGLVRLELDVAALREELDRRLAAGVEMVVTPRRGRPEKSRESGEKDRG
jgi:hypothetical protein